MASNAKRRALMRRYILGTLSERERELVEEEYIGNAEAQAELMATCDDTIDDYLQGQLSDVERQRLEQRANRLPILRRKLRESRSLLQAIDDSKTKKLTRKQGR